MDRRDFHASGLGTALAAAALAGDKANLDIIDTHTHFYDPTRPQGVPWPAKDNKALYRPVLRADDFEKRLRRFAKGPVYRGIRISHGDLHQKSARVAKSPIRQV